MSNFETENSFEYHHIDLNWGNKTNERIRSRELMTLQELNERNYWIGWDNQKERDKNVKTVYYLSKVEKITKIKS